jgi:hypothetical protein
MHRATQEGNIALKGAAAGDNSANQMGKVAIADLNLVNKPS